MSLYVCDCTHIIVIFFQLFCQLATYIKFYVSYVHVYICSTDCVVLSKKLSQSIPVEFVITVVPKKFSETPNAVYFTCTCVSL